MDVMSYAIGGGPIPIEERFWPKVRKTKTCWKWTGSISNHGYGHIRFRETTWKAHRVSWILANGEIPHNLYVLHACDNRSCMNPKHLFLGTYKDNTQDMIRKGRSPDKRGEKNSMSKLNNKDVKKIRKTYQQGKITMRALAQKFGVSYSRIWDVINKTTWKHI